MPHGLVDVVRTRADSKFSRITSDNIVPISILENESSLHDFFRHHLKQHDLNREMCALNYSPLLLFKVTNGSGEETSCDKVEQARG